MIDNDFNNELASLVGENPSQFRYLLGVSGGIDSICMAELFHRSSLGLKFSVAHVNFSLRGIDSELDMEFVKEWAESRDIEFHCKVAHTHEYMEERLLSIQMAAREIRYNWFYELMQENGYDYLVIAHNLNDSIETMVLNILRGTGIKGLVGISPKNGNIIRPLLNFTRKQIEEYVHSNGFMYREDITNYESHYSRNRVRNIIFPEFAKINPSFLQTMRKDALYFQQSQEILEELYSIRKRDFLNIEPDRVMIDKNVLMRYSHPEYWLYQVLKEYGFNSSQSEDVYNSVIYSQSGKIFLSANWKLVVDRDSINLYPSEPYEKVSFVIRHPGKFHFRDEQLTIKVYPKPKHFYPAPKYSGQMFLDADKVQFPILCRTWLPADKFRPLGMRMGEKKVSDFFIDNKVERVQKDNVPLLFSNHKLVALLGMRPDERYKITKKTVNVMEIRLGKIPESKI